MGCCGVYYRGLDGEVMFLHSFLFILLTTFTTVSFNTNILRENIFFLNRLNFKMFDLFHLDFIYSYIHPFYWCWNATSLTSWLLLFLKLFFVQVLVDLHSYSPCSNNPDHTALNQSESKPQKIREIEVAKICETEEKMREEELVVRRPRRQVSPLFNIEKIIEEELAAFKVSIFVDIVSKKRIRPLYKNLAKDGKLYITKTVRFPVCLFFFLFFFLSVFICISLLCCFIDI